MRLLPYVFIVIVWSSIVISHLIPIPLYMIHVVNYWCRSGISGEPPFFSLQGVNSLQACATLCDVPGSHLDNGGGGTCTYFDYNPTANGTCSLGRDVFSSGVASPNTGHISCLRMQSSGQWCRFHIRNTFEERERLPLFFEPYLKSRQLNPVQHLELC